VHNPESLVDEERLRLLRFCLDPSHVVLERFPITLVRALVTRIHLELTAAVTPNMPSGVVLVRVRLTPLGVRACKSTTSPPSWSGNDPLVVQSSNLFPAAESCTRIC
jgi:hypothetical protein